MRWKRKSDGTARAHDMMFWTARLAGRVNTVENWNESGKGLVPECVHLFQLWPFFHPLITGFAAFANGLDKLEYC